MEEEDWFNVHENFTIMQLPEHRAPEVVQHGSLLQPKQTRILTGQASKRTSARADWGLKNADKGPWLITLLSPQRTDPAYRMESWDIAVGPSSSTQGGHSHSGLKNLSALWKSVTKWEMRIW